MNKKVIFSSLLVCLLTLSLIFVSCDHDGGKILAISVSHYENFRYGVGDPLNTEGMVVYVEVSPDPGTAGNYNDYGIESGWTLGLASNRDGSTDYKDVPEGYIFTQEDKDTYPSGSFYLIVKYEGQITGTELVWKPE